MEYCNSTDLTAQICSNMYITFHRLISVVIDKLSCDKNRLFELLKLFKYLLRGLFTNGEVLQIVFCIS